MILLSNLVTVLSLSFIVYLFFKHRVKLSPEAKAAEKKEGFDISDRMNQAMIKHYEIQGFPYEQAVIRLKWLHKYASEEEKNSHREFCDNFVAKKNVFSDENHDRLKNMVDNINKKEINYH